MSPFSTAAFSYENSTAKINWKTKNQKIIPWSSLSHWGKRSLPSECSHSHVHTVKYNITEVTEHSLAVCECMSFAKSWQEKGCSSQAETWQVKNILMKDFDWQVKFDVFVVSMATWTIEYNLKISLLFSLHKIRSLDFPINLHTAYCN